MASRAVKVARAPAHSAVMVLAEIQGAIRHAGCPASVAADSTEAVDSTVAAVVIANRVSRPFITI
jgi:pyruvate/2-oxoacid:ferredoxin oxidoreductase alpha subunit